MAVYQDFPLVKVHNPDNRADRCCFPRAIVTNKSMDFSRFYCQIQTVNRFFISGINFRIILDFQYFQLTSQAPHLSDKEALRKNRTYLLQCLYPPSCNNLETVLQIL